MPFEEQPTEPGQLNVMAKQAHLLRTKGRIAWWSARLLDNPDEAMKALALQELEKYERQLREPLTARTLRKLEQRQLSPMERMVQSLQEEVARLKANLLGTPTAQIPAEPVAQTLAEPAPTEPAVDEASVVHGT